MTLIKSRFDEDPREALQRDARILLLKIGKICFLETLVWTVNCGCLEWSMHKWKVAHTVEHTLLQLQVHLRTHMGTMGSFFPSFLLSFQLRIAFCFFRMRECIVEMLRQLEQLILTETQLLAVCITSCKSHATLLCVRMIEEH